MTAPPTLRTVYIDSTTYEEIEWLGTGRDLEVMYFENGLDDLPDTFSGLSEMRVFFIEYNSGDIAPYFPEMPEEVRSWTKLEELIFRDTRLETLPAWVGELTQLRTLDLGGLGLPSELTGAIPETITNLTVLETLDFGFGSCLTASPSVIAFLDAQIPGWQTTSSWQEGC